MARFMNVDRKALNRESKECLEKLTPFEPAGYHRRPRA
jgi:hypothetical protein